MGICVTKDIDEGDRIAALDDLEGGEDSYQAPPSYYSDRQETRCGPTPGAGPNDIMMGPPLSMKPGEQQSLFIRREADEEVLSAHQMLMEIDRLRELVQNMNDDGIGLIDLVDSEDMYLGDTSAKKSEVRKSLSRRSHNSTLEESSVRLRSSSKLQANTSMRSSASNSPFNSSLPPSQVVTPNQSPRKKPKTNSTKKVDTTTRKVVKRDTTDSRKRKEQEEEKYEALQHLGFRNKDKKWKPYKPDKHIRDPSNSHWLAPRIPKLKEPGKAPRKLGPRDIGRNKSTPYDYSKHPISKSNYGRGDILSVQDIKFESKKAAPESKVCHLTERKNQTSHVLEKKTGFETRNGSFETGENSNRENLGANVSPTGSTFGEFHNVYE